MTYTRTLFITLSLLTLSACDAAKSPHRQAADEMVRLTHSEVLAPIFSESFSKAASEKGVLREALKDQLPDNVPDECVADLSGVGSDFAGYLFDGSMVTGLLADAYEENMPIETINAFNNIVVSGEGKKMLSAVTNARLGNTSTDNLATTIKNIAQGAISLFSQGSGKTLATSLSTIIPAYSNVIGTLGADKSALQKQFVGWLLENPEARSKVMAAASSNSSCGSSFEALNAAKGVWDMLSPMVQGATK